MEKLRQEERPSMHLHLLFWLALFCCYVFARYELHSGGWSEIFVTYTFKVCTQAMVAYYCLLVILPKYFAGKTTGVLLLHLLGLLLVLQLLVGNWLYFYMYPSYPDTYSSCIIRYANDSYWERILNPISIFFKNPASYFPASIFLIALQYFQKQKVIIELSEQKKINELKALKNQMNPHFLFNTLNNLYALAVKKSDQTPEVIAKLSEILDYMLYRCNDAYVSINKEIELLNNYLGLEKIRYGNRVEIEFDYAQATDVEIAPLLLLHFVENAFKHGVSQETNRAKIQINLRSTREKIFFEIENSVPSTYLTANEQTGIGLQNIQRQLDLIYPNRHRLEVKNDAKTFRVLLELNTQIQ